LALGAFLAGLVVSGSRFREHAVGEIIPLRTIFNALFFVSIGMLLDIRFVVSQPLVLLAIAVGALVIKLAVTGAGVVLLRYPVAIAIPVALYLAQIGEFSLVLHQVGSGLGLSPAGLGAAGDQAFLAVAVLLMMATPFMVQLEPRLRALAARVRAEGAGTKDAETTGLSDHVIIGGYGLTGRYIQQLLANFGIPHLIVDMNPVSVLEAEAVGLPVIYGDLSQAHTQHRAGIERARLVVAAINDPNVLAHTVHQAKLANPAVEIIVRTPYVIDIEGLLEAGAHVVVSEELEAALRLVEQVLYACGIHGEEAERQVARIRAESEAG
jgi:CPA2 family monovalent cation:H+ antiporter-2